MNARIVCSTALAGLLVCSSSSLAAKSKGPDRSKPPITAEVPKFTVAVPERAALKNGITVLFLPKTSAHLVDVLLVVRGGSVGDPADRPGLAEWTAAMLEEGAGDKGALEFADAKAYLGASMGANSSWDATYASMHVASARFEQALALFSDMVLRPRFDAKEWARMQDERKTGFIAARDDPRALGGIAAAKALYGPHHRYGTPMMGTYASLVATKTDELKAFHKATFLAGAATIIVVGDVQKDQALQALERAFGGWTGKAPPAAAKLPAVVPIDKREIILVDKPGAAQSVVAVVKTTASPVTPYEPAVQVMNTLLGGSFTSRLNDNLREKHGYAYGAGSSFAVTRDVDSFGARASVSTPVTAQAIREILFELDRIRAAPTTAEAERARRYLALNFPGEFETGRAIATLWAGAEVLDVPAAQIQSFMTDTAGVTPDKIAGAAKQHVDPERMRIIVVGDRAQIEQSLRDLNVGPVTVWSIDDVLPVGAAKK